MILILYVYKKKLRCLILFFLNIRNMSNFQSWHDIFGEFNKDVYTMLLIMLDV